MTHSSENTFGFPRSGLLAAAIVMSFFANTAFAQQVLVTEKAVVALIDNVQVPAEEAGVIQDVLVKEGDTVTEGDVIVELDNQVQHLQVAIAAAESAAAQLAATNQADIEYAEKSSEMARKTLERSTRANQRSAKAVSTTEIERLQLELERGQLATKQARMQLSIAQAELSVNNSQLAAAKLKLDRRSIKAPISGKVVERLAQKGEWVNSGQPLLRIVRLDRLRVQCILPASKFDESLVDNEVEFIANVAPNGDEMTFTGKVTFVSPEIILQRDQITVWAEIENTDMKLRPNNTGTLRIFDKN